MRGPGGAHDVEAVGERVQLDRDSLHADAGSRRRIQSGVTVAEHGHHALHLQRHAHVGEAGDAIAQDTRRLDERAGQWLHAIHVVHALDFRDQIVEVVSPALLAREGTVGKGSRQALEAGQGLERA